jgi:hypothetical protein
LHIFLAIIIFIEEVNVRVVHFFLFSACHCSSGSFAYFVPFSLCIIWFLVMTSKYFLFIKSYAPFQDHRVPQRELQHKTVSERRHWNGLTVLKIAKFADKNVWALWML